MAQSVDIEHRCIQVVAHLEEGRLTDDELGHLLMPHFPEAQYTEDGPDEVVYSAENGDTATLVYVKDAVSRFEFGHVDPSTAERILDEIDREAANTAERVTRNVVFSRVPTDAAWRYQDRFQIAPVPPQAPKPRMLIGDHPLILEVRVRTSDNIMLMNGRTGEALLTVALLLNVLVRDGIKLPSLSAQKHWMLVQDSPPPDFRLHSEFLQEGYTFEGGFPGGDDEFVSDVPQCDVVPTLEHYGRLQSMTEKRFDVPEIATEFFDRYYALGVTDQRRFLRACHWYVVSDEAWSVSHSVSFTALVQAIEALLDVPDGAQICGECGRSIGAGPTKLFTEFVKRYAPDTNAAVRRRLYSKRSALTHGGTLLSADERSLSALSPLRVQEHMAHDELREITRAVLINWLFGPGNAKVRGVVTPRPVSSFMKSVRIGGQNDAGP